MKMKYKIQMANALGQYGDMKTSYDDGASYEVELFGSREEAKAEISEMCEALAEDQSGYRIVREDKPQDVDYYN
jgi:hypothetical protein